ncbi:MAG: prenyltransferase [Xenococcaceae cyanobacterium MO_188.B19]|nr:prenyltransferase [Xenococcaceae cyanobacterium MO_188.B19]
MFYSNSQEKFRFRQWLYQRFLELAIYSSLWTAAGVASLVYFVQETLNLPYDWRAVALIFASALLFYNLDRLLDSYLQPLPDPKAQSYVLNPTFRLFLLVTALAVGLLLYNAPSQVRLVSCAALLPLIYGMPLLPWTTGQNWRWYRLKDIPGSKAWIVAGIVTYALVAVPLAYAETAFNQSAALIATFLLIFTGTNSHLFDVRDLKSDQEKGVQTLPLIVGVRGNRLIWTSLNLSFVLLLGWFWKIGLRIPGLEAVILSVLIINLVFIWFLNPDTPRNVYNICLDGCLFLPVLLILGVG